MTTYDADALNKVSRVEYITLLTLWLIYCCTGRWSPDQPLRLVALLQSSKILLRNIWLRVRNPAMLQFIVHMLDRYTLATNRVGM